MKKVLLTFGLLAFVAVVANAQTTATPAQLFVSEME